MAKCERVNLKLYVNLDHVTVSKTHVALAAHSTETHSLVYCWSLIIEPQNCYELRVFSAPVTQSPTAES